MKQFLLLFSLLFFLVATSCDKATPSDETIFDQGVEAYDAGNYDLAFQKFYSLAQKGNGEAQYVVGYMYFYGLGVAIDLVRAYMWVSLSIENLSPENASDPEVTQEIIQDKNSILVFMTAAEKRQAEQLATACKAKNYKDC